MTAADEATEAAAAGVTSDERRVLAGVLRGQRAVARTPKPHPYPPWNLEDWQNCRKHGPKYSPALITGTDDHVPEAIRARFLRAVYKLAERGLLVATRTAGRLSHVKLTPAGELLATTSAADADTPDAGAE